MIKLDMMVPHNAVPHQIRIQDFLDDFQSVHNIVQTTANDWFLYNQSRSMLGSKNYSEQNI